MSTSVTASPFPVPPGNPASPPAQATRDSPVVMHVDNTAYQVSLNAGFASLQGRGQDGMPFSVSTSGDSRVVLSQPGKDGLHQQTSFAFDEHPLVGLPDGNVLVLGRSREGASMLVLGQDQQSVLQLQGLGPDRQPRASLCSLGEGQLPSLLQAQLGLRGHEFPPVHYQPGAWPALPSRHHGAPAQPPGEHGHADLFARVSCAQGQPWPPAVHPGEGRVPYASWLAGPCGRGLVNFNPGNTNTLLGDLLGRCPAQPLPLRMQEHHAAHYMHQYMQNLCVRQMTRGQMTALLGNPATPPWLGQAAHTLLMNRHLWSHSHASRGSLCHLSAAKLWALSQQGDQPRQGLAAA